MTRALLTRVLLLGVFVCGSQKAWLVFLVAVLVRLRLLLRLLLLVHALSVLNVPVEWVGWGCQISK